LVRFVVIWHILPENSGNPEIRTEESPRIRSRSYDRRIYNYNTAKSVDTKT
jgi:hypothetical protein